MAGLSAGLLVLAGCATPAPRNSSLPKRIEPARAGNITAYCAGNTVEIHYPLRNKHAVAHASWIPHGGDAEYQCRFSALTFGAENRTARKWVVAPGNRVEIRDAAQWKKLLYGVFASLAPRQPGHGVLLLAQDMELVLFRTATGEVKVTELENKPSDIVMDNTFSDADFSRQAIKLLGASVSARHSKQDRFLFLTGANPAFVLVDRRAHLVVFLSYPADPETQPPAVSG
ncbi:MAG: hypothetical protein ACRED1_15565, partial [Limisphaerales bacterium]